MLLAALVVFSPPSARAEAKKDGSAVVRRVLLRDYLQSYRGRATAETYVPGILGVVTLAFGVGVAVAGMSEDASGRSRWVFAGTYGAASAVSLGSYALPADYRFTSMSTALGVLLLGTGAGFYASSRATPTIRFSCAAIAGTGLVYGGLAITDAALERPISAATLAHHLDRLEQTGHAVSDGEVAMIERDFARTARPIPRWMFPLTLGVGGLVAVSPVFLNDTRRDDRVTVGVLGTILLMPAGISIITLLASERTSYGSYAEALHNVQLTPLGPAGSAGVTLAGQF